MSKKKARPPLPDLMDFSVRVEGLQYKSPTELVILSMAYLDKALELALVASLETLEVGVRYALFEVSGGPLRSLAGKMELARALGIVGPHAHKDMQALRRIRNEFAHRFDDPSWADPDMDALLQGLVLDHTMLNEDLPHVELQTIAADQVIPLSGGAAIDTNVHDVITDQDGRIGFFCRHSPAVNVTDPSQRRYLQSYWAVLFQVMAVAVTEWDKHAQ
jgi:DNA-binding MltR family transcriptional regulator